MRPNRLASQRAVRRESILARAILEPLEIRTMLANLTIAQENALPGTPEGTWDISGNGDTNLQGFATDISVNRGNTISFKIDDNTVASYHIDVYRLGYYGGNGARFIATIPTSATTEKNQPNPLTNSSTGLVDCGNWTVSASWSVPADATSGVYIARLQYDGSSGASHIPFIVRNDASTSDLVFQTSDTTWQAYNDYGGNSLYVGSPAGRAYKVSYNRPFYTRGDSTEDNLFNSEYPMIRFLERNGYDLSYISGIDTDRLGVSNLTRHKTYLSVGHDEYWSGNQRANVEAARNAGVNLAFFSGNEMFWKTRWENSIDGSGTPYRTLVCYKETHAGAKIDPTSAWTGTWRNPRFSPPADGGRPENAVSGTWFLVNSGTSAIKVPAADGKARFWRNTTVATQSSGATATLAAETLGYEWDTESDNGFRPAGLIHLSTTTVSNVEVLQDYGSTYGSGTANHYLTLYKASSGALVFGAGTIQWPWGLDSNHDRGSGAADVRMQQATVNLLADMSVQPATLMSGLVAATKSTDTTGPTTVISSPANNSNLNLGQSVTVSGTASDSGGGIVAGVEYSIDGGATWHPATGKTAWSFSYSAINGGQASVLIRGIDDSANMGATATLTLNVQGPSGETIFGAAIPTTQDPDGSSTELGTKFRSDVNGVVTGMRFYKFAANTGTHVGSLWTSAGTLLSRVTFSGESTSGWQFASFATPINITANSIYVVSYHAPVGKYAGDTNYFNGKGAGTGHIKALADGVSGPNGVYAYGSGPLLPNLAWMSANYYVDVFFSSSVADTTPPNVTAQTPANNATNIAANTTVTATFNEAVNSGSIVFSLKNPSSVSVAGTGVYDSASRTYTFTPSSPLAAATQYTASITAADTTGNAMTSAFTWKFTTDATPPGVTNATPASNATNVPANTTTTATFNEPINPASLVFTLNNGATGVVTYNSGNNTATFTPSGNLTLGVTYIASVSAADVAGNAMASAFTWSFTITPPDLTPPNVTNNTPANSATNVPANTTATATFNEPINQATLVFTLDHGASGIVGYNNATRVATFTPSGNLTLGVIYTASVSAADLSGNPMGSPFTWSFTTTPPDLTPPNVTNVTPANGATNIAIGTAVTAAFNEPINQATLVFTLNNGAVAGVVSYNSSTNTATFTPSASLAYSTLYTASVRAADTSGNLMGSATTWTFTTAAAPAASSSIFASSTVPANPNENDGSAVELGVKFKSDIAGFIKGIRFYKSTANTGTHIGTLWSSTGTNLARATFSGETGSGWQQVLFSTPVAITANTTYVASYHTNTGHYSEDDNYFAAQIDNGNLHALSNSAGGGNGVYRYSSSAIFPNQTWASANYYVDIVFSISSSVAAVQAPVVSAAPAPTALATSGVSSLLVTDQKIL